MDAQQKSVIGDGWEPITPVKKLKVSKDKNEKDVENLKKSILDEWTAFKSVATGEIVFAFVYQKETIPLNDDQIEAYLQLMECDESKPDMDTICKNGNREPGMGLNAYLPDQFFFNWVSKHNKKVRGKEVKTWEEYLSIVRNVERPAVSQSIHSPGQHQQHAATAAIVAEPTALPPIANATPPPAARQRKKPGPKPKVDSDEDENAKPIKKRKAPAKEPVAPKEVEKAEPAPKRQKKPKMVASTTAYQTVITTFGTKLASGLSKLSEAKKAELAAKYSNYIEISEAERTPDAELNNLEIAFVLAYLATTELTVDIVQLGGTFVTDLDEKTCAAVSHFQKNRSKTFGSIKEFVETGISYRSSPTAKTIFIYNKSVVSALVSLAEDPDNKISALLKDLKIGGTLVGVFYNSLSSPKVDTSSDIIEW